MPNGTALQIHFLAITERITALGAPGTGWMEVMVLSGLQHFTTNKAIAVGTLDTERFLVALFTVRHTVLAHVLAIQHGSAVLATETPNVPLSFQRDQRLTLFQLIPTTGTLVRIIVPGCCSCSICRMTSVLMGCCLRWATAGDLLYGRCLHLIGGWVLMVVCDMALWCGCRGNWSSNAFFANHLFSGVGNLKRINILILKLLNYIRRLPCFPTGMVGSIDCM